MILFPHRGKRGDEVASKARQKKQLAARQRARTESLSREQRIGGMWNAFWFFAGYMQSREATYAKRRYRNWRRAHERRRTWIAVVCEHGDLSAADALELLNDTMEGR